MVFFENSISMRERVINTVLGVLVSVAFIVYLLYSEKTRTKEKGKIINFLRKILVGQ